MQCNLLQHMLGKKESKLNCRLEKKIIPPPRTAMVKMFVLSRGAGIRRNASPIPVSRRLPLFVRLVKLFLLSKMLLAVVVCLPPPLTPSTFNAVLIALHCMW